VKEKTNVQPNSGVATGLPETSNQDAEVNLTVTSTNPATSTSTGAFPVGDSTYKNGVVVWRPPTNVVAHFVTHRLSKTTG
jgi:hypothetical protein